MCDHAKAARKAAKKIAAGGLTKKQKQKLVRQWAQDMKAMINAGKK